MISTNTEKESIFTSKKYTLVCTFYFLLCFSFQSCKSSTSNINSPENDNLIIDTTKKNRLIDIMQTPELIVDSRDGETYETVLIGDQIWMAENVRYNINGSYLYSNYPSTKYGRLYSGEMAEIACSKGWHLPSDFEWNKMELFLGMEEVDTSIIDWRGSHGKELKSVSGWTSETGSQNSIGFNALPAGYFTNDVTHGEFGYGGFGQSTGFWCAKELNEKKAYVRFLAAPLDGVNRFDDKLEDDFYLACRCIKD